MKLSTLFTASAASLALLASAPALAEAHREAPAAEAALPSGPEGPALWKVADDDTTIYLFGTVHALDPNIVWYDAEIDAALSSSDTIVTEILMDPASEAAMQQMALERAVFTDGTTLRSLLNEEQSAAYEAGMTGLGIPAQAFDQLEPWMAGLTFTMLPLLQQGYDLEAGVDKVILRKAGSTPKDALETAEFQLDIFEGMSQDAQIEFMMAAVEGMGEVKETLDSLVAEWMEGDPDGIAAIMNEDMGGEEIAQAMLYDRNENWAEWIESRLERTPGTVFIAVGAAHLAGEGSVQDYLAERDIETDRIQ